MPLKIVRNDITKMNTEAIVNTASSTLEVGPGCDIAIYKAAGFDKLHKVREDIGNVPEGEVFITPGFDLPAKYIIHAVSPFYIDGRFGEEEKLRSCYRKSLELAKENNIKSISFPLIATGSFGYPRAYGLRIAMDEINSFLLENEMDINLVVFDSVSTELAEKLHPQIDAFIKHEDVCRIREDEYGDAHFNSISPEDDRYYEYVAKARELERRLEFVSNSSIQMELAPEDISDDEIDYEEELDFSALGERIDHIKDSFGKYLIYLAKREGKTLTELENIAWISKHVVYRVKKDPENYKPDKRTAFQFCVGLGLSLDDTKDLLSRAGYAISPSSLEDKIWEFYIENEHYDVIDVNDSLEYYGIKGFINF